MTLAALCLAGIGVLVDRHRRAQRPLRLCDRAAGRLLRPRPGDVRGATLRRASEWPCFVRSSGSPRHHRLRARRVPHRAARRPPGRAGGDLFVQLRTDLGRPSSAAARPRAARPLAVARLLAPGVRELGRPRRPRGDAARRRRAGEHRDRAGGVPGRGARPRPLADRRARAARRRDGGCRDRPGERAPPGGAACAARGAGGSRARVLEAARRSASGSSATSTTARSSGSLRSP